MRLPGFFSFLSWALFNIHGNTCYSDFLVISYCQPDLRLTIDETTLCINDTYISVVDAFGFPVQSILD